MEPVITVPSVSVVIVSYHTGPALWLSIESALEQPECSELVLVDNGNGPGTLARLSAYAETEPRFRLVSGHGNVGFAKACNMGARMAQLGEFILFLNPDSMLPEGGLARAIEVFRDFPDNTLAGCHLVDPDGSEQRASRRSLLTPENAISESLGLAMFRKSEERLNLQGTPMPEYAHEVPAISGAF
ncbi:MAG: glycosyltransferase family 2 protein, partial [Candidatus Sungbacteria bacterium]|nr:glycosyltransferase family 2 protein [Candidatus Sungbacteria bacterium]